jgi:cob(I)alamin adenosyltransferase
MRLDRIYTKVGDKGKTLLANGEKVDKFDSRIEAYGTVDELNSVVGLVRDHLHAANSSLFSDACAQLEVIQNELFDIGGELATPSRSLNLSLQQVVRMEAVDRLETEIDKRNSKLAPLKNFVLPSGHPCVSFCHLARCVCRRAERKVFSLNRTEAVRSEVCIYLNRLSDWLFVLGREISQDLNIKEILWQQRGR